MLTAGRPGALPVSDPSFARKETVTPKQVFVIKFSDDALSDFARHWGEHPLSKVEYLAQVLASHEKKKEKTSILEESFRAVPPPALTKQLWFSSRVFVRDTQQVVHAPGLGEDGEQPAMRVSSHRRGTS